jgi:Zn-dependent M16 (insulinase) family peptidase
MYKVEFKIEVDERALKVIEHKLKRLEDDFYQSAEAMAMIQSKSQYYDTDQYQRIADGVDELTTKFQAGEITQAQYIEGLG